MLLFIVLLFLYFVCIYTESFLYIRHQSQYPNDLTHTILGFLQILNKKISLNPSLMMSDH